MQRYRWPGYEIQLLRELQRQQNNAQFCDTLLQTDGISVPTHSCILAALSPYLSQQLSTSPSPPSGQKRQLQLQAVKARTLLKLVRLLYSGELEVRGSVEQNDVLSAARQFGITDLLEGPKDGGMEELQRKENESWEMLDAHVLAKRPGRREADPPTGKRSCVSTGTQTVDAGEKTAGRSLTHSGQTKHLTPEPASAVAQSLNFFTSSPPQSVTPEDMLCSTSFPPIPSMPSGASSDGESTLDRSSDSATKSTSSSSSNGMTAPISLDESSNSPTPQEDGIYRQPSALGGRIRASAEDGTGLKDGKMADERENREQSCRGKRDEMLAEKTGNSTEKRHAHAGMKSLAKMQHMMETTHISIKVKLRRRTKGEVWEVVSVQDTEEMSVLTSWKQDGSVHKRPQAALTNGAPPPSPVQPAPIHRPILQPASTYSPDPAADPKTSSDSQDLSGDYFSPNQNDGLKSVPLPQPPGPVEESDEQIEKLLEDIMMGLNILPNLETNCKKSHHLQLSHEAPTVLCAPVTENPMHAAVSAAGCVCYQDYGTQIGLSSTDTGIHCCFTAQNQPSCSSLSPVQPDAVLSQQEQQQCSPQCHSSVTSMGQRDGASHEGMLLSTSQNCLYPEAATTRSDIPTACYSSGQKLHYPACQEQTSQDGQNILEFLPLTNGNEAQSSHSFSLPYMDVLRLPQCLSPLEPSPSAAKRQHILSNSAKHCHKILPLPSLDVRPWLAEIPGSLQFPLSAITHRDTKRASLSQEETRSCWSKQRQKPLELNPQNGGTWAESRAVEERGTISAGHHNATELKSDPRKVLESSKCGKGDAAAPKRRKRKRTCHPQDAPCSLFAWKDVKVSDGQINLSVCSVSLSSNNVLAKERKMATSSSTTPDKFGRKPSKPSTITEGLKGKTRGPGDLSSDRTRIRTRGFLKKSGETPCNTSLENASVLKPVAATSKIVHKQEVSLPRRKRGRPPKKKPELSPPESSPAIIEKSHSVKSEQQLEKEEDKTKRCKKRWRSRSEDERIPPKKTSAESTGEAEADDITESIPAGRELRTPKQPRRVILKEFQKLIKSQHSKTRKSKESQDKETSETARDVDEELSKETEMDMDVTPSQNRDGFESHVIVNVAVDSNHNEIFPQRDDTNSSTSQGASLLGEEYHPAWSPHILGEEEAKLAAEREQPSKNPDEALHACDAGASETVRCVVDSSRLCCDALLPQEDKMPLDPNLNPQTPEGAGQPPSDAVRFSKSSGCDQEEEEREEEVEVDVLVYSPDNAPQTRECENGLDNMDINAEEEEEEDVNEIDVTGDEAE